MEGQPSPWATGEIPAGPAPDFAWEQPDEPHQDVPPDAGDPSRRNQVLVAIGCVMTLALGAVALWPTDDAPIDTTDADDRPVTTLGTLPDTDTDDEPTETEPSSDGTIDDLTDETSDGVLAARPESGTGTATSIELPDAVAAIALPTEIVLTGNGEIITVSLPSGNIRRTPVIGSFETNVIVAPDAAAWSAGTKLNIIPRLGPALSTDFDTSASGGVFPFDWLADESGSTTFLVSTFAQDGNTQYAVGLDGGVEEYEPERPQFDPFEVAIGLRQRAGGQIVNDAGGVYLVVEDDVERISTGRALAATDSSVLLRECDEALVCSYLVLDRATGDRRPSPVTAEQLGTSGLFDLSPDGTATLTYDFQRRERRLVDLATGTVIATWALPIGTNNNTRWAADNSGVFEIAALGEGLDFIDRASGTSTPFATELGRISGIGVRMPDAELEPEDNVVAVRPFTFSEEPSGSFGLDIVVLGDLGSMAHLDLDNSTASVWAVPATPSSNPPDLVSVGGEIVVVPAGRSDGFVSTFGETRALDLSEGAELPGYPRFPGSEPDAVWSPRDGSGDGVDHQVVNVYAGVEQVGLGGAVRLANSELLGEDGNGLLVARVGGDIFVVAVIGTSKLTDGELLALGPDHALVRTCDDSLQCSVDRVDRASGDLLAAADRSPELVQVLDQARDVRNPSQSPRLSGTMSPDGSAALLRSAPGGNSDEWLLIDFDTGGHFIVPSPADGQPIIWNDDSSAAVYLSDGTLHMIERETGRTVSVDGVGEVRSLTAVGADFGS